MSLNNFIPEIWSARLMASLKDNLRYAQPNVMNRDYEGEIREVGDTVHINAIGTVTINNYSRNTDILPPQELQDATSTLTIDQQKYFHFQIDDLDAAQMKPNVMQAAMDEAAYQLSAVADAYVATIMVNGASATNAMGTNAAPIEPTASTAYEHLVDLGVKLDEAKVPTNQRFAIIPPWYKGLLLKDDRFTHATAQGDDLIRNGVVGRVSGITLIESTNVPNTGGELYKIVAGTPMATTYAEQVNKVEAYRPERRFADAVKGIHLYGAKVLRPEALAVMTATP